MPNYKITAELPEGVTIPDAPTWMSYVEGRSPMFKVAESRAKARQQIGSPWTSWACKKAAVFKLSEDAGWELTEVYTKPTHCPVCDIELAKQREAGRKRVGSMRLDPPTVKRGYPLAFERPLVCADCWGKYFKYWNPPAPEKVEYEKDPWDGIRKAKEKLLGQEVLFSDSFSAKTPDSEEGAP